MGNLKMPNNEGGRLDDMIIAIEQVFVRHSADNYDRLDVLAKMLGFVLSWSELPDREAAIVEVDHMVRQYLKGYELARRP